VGLNESHAFSGEIRGERGSFCFNNSLSANVKRAAAGEATSYKSIGVEKENR
jgi:hypothetical protein